MKVETMDGRQERRILTALITDGSVLNRIAPHWGEAGLFKSKWSNLVAGWCIRHFAKYGQAPGKQIQTRFEHWCEKNSDETTQKLVESFLGSLSDEYEQNGHASSDYLVDLAAEYFNKVRLEKLATDIQSHVESGDGTKALEQLNGFRRIELGVGAGIDVLSDTAAAKAAFKVDDESLVAYPGALGPFFRHALVRDALVAFMAPTARGKTFWLLDVAWRAIQQKRRVVFFEIGDLSQHQILRRFYIRASKRPIKSCTVRVPVSVDLAPKGRRATPTFAEKRFTEPLDAKKAIKALRKVCEGGIESGLLKVSCHPNGTIGTAELVSFLESWDRAGWTPDIIVIDYADLLTSPVRGEHWEKVDATWKALRGLSQSRHCLILTATQGNADSLGANTMKASHFSGSMGVLRHSTAVAGISQTDAEKRDGVSRLNWLKLREADFDTTIPCHVAGSLELANPAIKSTF